MALVHSLVRTETGGKTGWCAPVELGEATPQYVSFVLPVDTSGAFHDRYTCETVTAAGADRRSETHELVRQGPDSFVLRLGKREFWFTVRPVSKAERRLPYVGKLRHPDFAFLLTEIEPEDLEGLDQLCEDEGTFVIGCEPFTHYSGIKRMAKKR